MLKGEFGQLLAKGYLERLLKNPFYKANSFGKVGSTTARTRRWSVWKPGSRCKPFFAGHNKPKYRKHEFAFTGLLHCAYDKCAITAEFKKNRYTYYRCTGYRGKCDLPRFREADLGDRLAFTLRNIHIPDDVLIQLEQSLLADKGREEAIRKEQGERLRQRLSAVRQRLDKAYLDKLDGKITEEFWSRKSAEWLSDEEQHVLSALQSLQQATPERMLDATRALELANKAYFLYLRQEPTEKAKLLKVVLLNYGIDGVTVYPTYRKPFDLIFARAKNEEWRA